VLQNLCSRRWVQVRENDHGVLAEATDLDIGARSAAICNDLTPTGRTRGNPRQNRCVADFAASQRSVEPQKITCG
jgi:hypothetical protein